VNDARQLSELTSNVGKGDLGKKMNLCNRSRYNKSKKMRDRHRRSSLKVPPAKGGGCKKNGSCRDSNAGPLASSALGEP
jgi:hypothetical protein